MPKKSSEDKKVAEHIWAIRDSIQDLEDTKDSIIQFFQEELELGDSEDHIWISDTKGAYFNIVAAWQMLNSCTRQKPEDQNEKAESSLKFLMLAKSHMGQSASELRALKNERATELETRWKKTFEVCFQSISKQLERYLDSDEGTPPQETIEKIEDGKYRLFCTVCGRVAIVIIQEGKLFVYSGIVVESALDKSLAKEVFRLLDKGDLKGLHSYVKNSIQLEDGIDAYCPECDKIYCAQHYRPEEEWDEGFYDCTYGTCPEGHRRIIHD